MRKILVLGNTGMLGHLVESYLRDLEKYEIIGLNRITIKAEMKESEIERVILNHQPDYIINCIGLINRYANLNSDLAKKVNSDFPHLLAYLSIKNNWKLIHISTDCYLDDDIYGKSKKLGEINDSHNLTVRTSIIGPELKEGFGLFHWFLSQKESVKGFTRAMWDGVTTLELAKFIEEDAIPKGYTGLIDFRTRNSISKYELLNRIKDIFLKNIEIIPDNREMKDKRNPKADIFCEKEYEKQLKELKDYMLDKQDKYRRYFQ